MMQKFGGRAKLKSRVYGLGGKDFFAEDVEKLLDMVADTKAPDFDYYGVTPGGVQETMDKGGSLPQ